MGPSYPKNVKGNQSWAHIASEEEIPFDPVLAVSEIKRYPPNIHVYSRKNNDWLVLSTPVKNISQLG